MTHYTCTSCTAKIKSTYEANIHPLIDVLVCRKCYQAYGNGDFATLWDDGVDEAGDDNYCRWCCDGGELYGCMNDERPDEDRCHYSFCKDCIKRNLPEDKILKLETLSEAERDKIKWFCYACDKSKLSKLAEQGKIAMKSLNEKEEEERKKKKSTSDPNAQSAKKRRTEVSGSSMEKSGLTVASSKPKDVIVIDKPVSRPVGRPRKDANGDPPKKPSTTQVASINKTVVATTARAASTRPSLPTTTSAGAAVTSVGATTTSAGAAVTSAGAAVVGTVNTNSRSSTAAAPVTLATSQESSPASNKTGARAKVAPDISIVPINKSSVARPVIRPKVSKDVTIVPVAKKSATTATKTNNNTPFTTTASVANPICKEDTVIKQVTKLNKEEVKIKLDAFRKLKDVCIEEVNIRFENVVNMYMSNNKQPSHLTTKEVISIREPVANIDMLLNDLKLLERSI